jgi:hypothetical protein
MLAFARERRRQRDQAWYWRKSRRGRCPSDLVGITVVVRGLAPDAVRDRGVLGDRQEKGDASRTAERF